MKLRNRMTDKVKDIGENYTETTEGYISWFNAKGLWDDIADFYPTYAWEEIQ